MKKRKEKKGNYYKPVPVSNFWSNNYINYGSNSEEYQLKNILIKLDHI